jgi:hypothetical protein
MRWMQVPLGCCCTHHMRDGTCSTGGADQSHFIRGEVVHYYVDRRVIAHLNNCKETSAFTGATVCVRGSVNSETWLLRSLEV